ncbi:hypothetical protein ON010_g17158 [Phytophthora cinnamomi]|nr:hypothetical protein ON010_g17158 [Phytophthora cinnamomi]
MHHFSPSECARHVHVAQRRFIESLQSPIQSSRRQQLLVGQYQEFATHYREELGRNIDESDHFTPTAAIVEFASSFEEWGNTTFRLTAAKATDDRLLTVTAIFAQGTFPSKSSEPCRFTVTIQREHNADTRQSHRIEWSCDVSDVLGPRYIPDDWEYLVTRGTVISPWQPNAKTAEGTVETSPWELGDELSAYDVLLRDVVLGASSHFADLDEIEAAWALWTPVVVAVERYPHRSTDEGDVQAALLQFISYPAGTSPWERLQSSYQLEEHTLTAREEL